MPYEVNVVFPNRVSVKKTYPNQLENRRYKADKACKGEKKRAQINKARFRLAKVIRIQVRNFYFIILNDLKSGNNKLLTPKDKEN